MLSLITRGIKGIVNVARRIGQRIKGNRRNAEIRDSNEPKKRTYVVTAVRDKKTCKICLGKDGITVTVTSSDSVKEIADRMRHSTPPFHINCRCQLVLV